MAAFLETSTSQQQHALELKVTDLYQDLAEFEGSEREDILLLLRDRHARYLKAGLGNLPGGFISLDASRPWICYWIVHGLALLDSSLPHDLSASDVISFLSSCQHQTGGYGGGPGQMPHLAPTYAAVSALLTLGGEEAYRSINREGMWDFLCRMAIPPEQGGGFRMHEGGESDARSCYTALAVASNLCLDVPTLVAKSGLVDYLRRCQTYEGGIGGEPGNEAHGGYTFCGLAALMLAGCPEALDLPRLLHWATKCQGWVEGGFNGRTNKLVDGCYSFWQGGAFPLLQQLLEDADIQDKQQQQQTSMGLGTVCSGVPTYAPLEPPSSWQRQQQQELVVPELPDLSRVLGPLQQVERDADKLNAVCDAVTEAALRSRGSSMHDEQQQQQQREQSAAASAADGDDAGVTSSQQQQQQLLERAQAAQKAAEYADENVAIAAVSAAVLFPCDAEGSNSSNSSSSSREAAGSGAAAAPTAVEEEGSSVPAGPHGGNDNSSSSDSGSSPNPLFNARALQCWILRACQQIKGGLKDKPGKPADYYHTCYCLSGLSTAQHIAGEGVVGPERNALRKVDPIANVLVDKLAAAKAYFGDLS